MKKFLGVVTGVAFFWIGVFAFVALAQSPSPAAASSAQVVGVLGFWAAYKGLLCGVIVAVLDLIFALNKSAASNGLLHWVLVQAKVVQGQQ